jgi:uncharacterized repeat protein (TIGR01451 family)
MSDLPHPAHLGSHRRRSSVLVSIAALVIAGATIAPSSAATPRSGSVGPSGSSVSWVGHHYQAAAIADPAAGGAGCPPEADPLDLVCDHFFLTVDVQADYWDTHTGGVRVKITWASAEDDFDMYVYKDGAVVQRSGGSVNQEEVFLQSPSGTYEIRVVPFLVTDEGADGVATFESVLGGQAPNPPRTTGGLGFGPSTVIDAQRTEGEPLNFVDPGAAGPGNSAYWESGPWGTTTQQSFVHRSVDGGDQYNIVSPIGLRPDPGPGGGDTDVVVDDQRTAYFTDLEALVNLDCAVSNDAGNTWRRNTTCVPTAGVDRQWYAVDNGLTSAPTDNTVFLAVRNVAAGLRIYSTPGSLGPTDPVGGLVFSDSSAGAPQPVAADTTCGQLRFDPVGRYLYYPCLEGNHIRMTVGHVNPGQRTGIVYTNVALPPSPGTGVVGDLFPGVAVDRAGNAYGVWIDEKDHNVYYSSSTDHGQTWSPAVQVNGGDTNSNEFAWVQAGAAGKVVVAWLGSPSHLDSDAMPSWFNNRLAASQFPWFGYVSLISNATSPSPTFAQQRFADHPIYYGQICNSGIACTATGGDRTMADYFGFSLDPDDGAIRVVYNDVSSQHHGAHLFEARQLSGPTALGTTLGKPTPSAPTPDPTGDARVPHYAPGGSGDNLRQFDFTSLNVSRPNAATLRVQMTLNNLSSLAPPPGETSGVWLTRFQALSVGEGGEEAYRIFYVGAESVGGAAPTFFAGSGDAAAPTGTPGDGCFTRNPQECKVVLYPAEVVATGSVAGRTITIDVPIDGGFGDGRPIKGEFLYNVTGLTFGRSPAAPGSPVGDFLYTEADATRSFNLDLVPDVADLEVTKTDAPDPVHVGQNLTYTVRVSNQGPQAATGVSLSDTLPKNAGFGSVSTSQGSCTIKPAKRLVTCSLGNLAAGGIVTVTIAVKPTSKGVISNTADVASISPPDPVTANNRATATTTVTP